MIKKYLKYVLLIIAALWVFSNKAYATEYLNSVSKDLSTFMSNSKLENYQMDTINFTKEENKSKESTVITNNVQGVSDKTAIKITAEEYDNAYIRYKYTGLKSRQFYSISAYVKVDDINNSTSDGGAKIVREGTPASSEFIRNKTDWKKISFVALSGEDGRMNIDFKLEESRGTILFDQIEIKSVEIDTDYSLYSYTNSNDKTARIVFRSDKVKGITEKEINSWLGVLLDLRSELTQITTKDFDNGNVDIIATNYYNPAVAYVIAGRTEIQWMTNYVDLTSLHNDFQNSANTPFFITHEMGHQHTSETCNFDSEF